jgi:hypothetical protein
MNRETHEEARNFIIEQMPNSLEYRPQNQRNGNIHTIQAEVHHSMNSQTIDNSSISNRNKTYSDMLKKKMNTNRRVQFQGQDVKTSQTVSTQTDPETIYNNGESATMTNHEKNDEYERILGKIKDFLIELFQTNIMKETTRVQELLIDSGLRNHFGKQRNEGKIEETTGVMEVRKGNRGSEKIIKKSISEKYKQMEVSTDSEVSHINKEDEIGIISRTDNTSEDDSTWETIEKKQIKTKNKGNMQNQRSEYKPRVRAVKKKRNSNKIQ